MRVDLNSTRRSPRLATWALVAGGTLCCGSVWSQSASLRPAQLDRVVAVVNNHAILSSDIADALRYSILDPESGNGGSLKPRDAMEQLVSRSLIQQQITEEDATLAQPSDAQVQARIQQIRRDLPICVREHCESDTGWEAFLLAHELTEAEVVRYERMRLQILGFIETRFRQGIRISDEDTEAYYRQTLLPQYARGGGSAPPLAEVAPRIQEILLQQQVNLLFTSWLDSLRKQGDVEVLDPALESPQDAQTKTGDEP